MAQEDFYDLAVVENVPFGISGMQGDFFALRIEKPGWKGWAPGQFVMIRPQSWTLEIPWARPFSISRVTQSEVVVFFQVTGKGTKRMAHLGRGDRVHLWGPLGNRFSVVEKPTLLLAGGVGIAPFLGYVDIHPKVECISMLFGHKHPDNCYPIEKLSERIHIISFQEQSCKDRDAFLLLVQKQMKSYADQAGIILACGPMPFLKFIQKFSLEYSVKTQLSLESRMACGIGACLGCVTQTTERWPVKSSAGMPVPTCTNGPVFWADQISLEDVHE